MRVAAIGCGRHATTALFPAMEVAGLDLVAVVATRLARAELAAERVGGRGYDDIKKMVGECSPDAVVVCVPPDAYADVIRECLDAKLPVFCEKPGAASATEATALAEEAARVERPVMVGYMKRFAPTYRRAHELIRSSEFGDPSLASFTFTVGTGYRSLEDYLIDNSVHIFDLARFLLGEPTEVSARTLEAGDHLAIAATATFGSGAVATFQLGTTGSWSQLNESVQVFGRGHSVEVRNVDTVTYRPPEPPEQVWRPNYTVPLPPNSSGVVMGFVPELEHFRAVVTDGVACESDLASAAATLKIVENLIPAR